MVLNRWQRAALPESRPTSSRPASGRPVSAALSETGKWLLQVQREEGPARCQRAFASDNLAKTALQEFIGTLNKSDKPLKDYTASGGLYLKYKACRNMDDPASRALGAENVDRLMNEMSLSSPSVRTVLRITDDLDLSQQTTSPGSDDLVKEIVGTASASFMTALDRLDELQEDVKLQRQEKKEQADANLSKVAYQALYGTKKAMATIDPEETVDVHTGSVVELEALVDKEQVYKANVKQFDEWMRNHLKTERKLAKKRELPKLPPRTLDMRLLGLA